MVKKVVANSPSIWPIPGALYKDEYLAAEQERDLITIIDASPWRIDLHRRVQHYGYRYNYKQRTIAADARLGPLPGWLQELAIGLVKNGLVPSMPDQAIINEYQPGQGISAHVDCIPCFGPAVATISLGSSCTMRFTNKHTKVTLEQTLNPRSILILTHEARYDWTHAIPARKSDTANGATTKRGRRLSITFRTIIINLDK